MKVTGIRTYDIEESIVASGFPMKTNYCSKKFEADVYILKKMIENNNYLENDHYKRACKLAKLSNGHNNFCKGMLCSFNVTLPLKELKQFLRYTFMVPVSSESTMHRIQFMNNDINFDEKTPNEVIETFRKYIEKYNNKEIDIDTLESCIPSGLLLTMRVNTNYMSLKNVYKQRENHRLIGWNDFRNFIKTLPFAKEFITGAK